MFKVAAQQQLSTCSPAGRRHRRPRDRLRRLRAGASRPGQGRAPEEQDPPSAPGLQTGFEIPQRKPQTQSKPFPPSEGATTRAPLASKDHPPLLRQQGPQVGPCCHSSGGGRRGFHSPARATARTPSAAAIVGGRVHCGVGYIRPESGPPLLVVRLSHCQWHSSVRRQP